MSVVLGLDAKLYRGTAGVQAATLMENVKDVGVEVESGEADVTTRKAKGWRLSVATLKTATIDFEMNYDPTDADFIALQTAFFSNTPLAFFVSDGLGTGLDADFTILKFSQQQPLEGPISVSVSIKPTDSNRAPTWQTGSGS